MRNILNEGKKSVVDIKNELLTLEEYRNRANEAKQREDKYEKELRVKKREVDEEVMSVIKKRRADVENTYRNQLSKKKSELKKKSNAREKTKDKKISDRIKEETKDYVVANKAIYNEIKSKMNNEKIPAICRTDLFLSLFMPANGIDLLKILFVAFVAFVPFPELIILITPWKEKLFLKVLLYALIILLIGATYIIVRNTVVAINHNVLSMVRERKKVIKSNQKKIKLISKKIQRDKDDSMYNLDDMDSDINKLNDTIDMIIKDQKDELATFDNSTKFMLENEIRSKHEKELEQLENQYDKAKKDHERLLEVVDKMTMDISKKYDAYLGKEFLRIDRLNALIEIMDKGEAQTISAAIDIYKSKYAV